MNDSSDDKAHAAEAGTVGELARSVSQVVSSALGVGAALTRLAARSTARGPLPEVRRETEPVAAMVHYGVVTLRNVAGLVTGGAQFLKVKAGMAPAAGDSAGPAQGAASPRLPSVHQGATLRMPLSIENPGDQPLGPIEFCVAQIEYRGTGAAGAAPLTGAAVRFAPGELSIRPHDFEKMTIYVDVPQDAATGPYHALIGSAAGNFRTEISFDVLPA